MIEDTVTKLADQQGCSKPDMEARSDALSACTRMIAALEQCPDSRSFPHHSDEYLCSDLLLWGRKWSAVFRQTPTCFPTTFIHPTTPILFTTRLRTVIYEAATSQGDPDESLLSLYNDLAV